MKQFPGPNLTLKQLEKAKNTKCKLSNKNTSTPK